MSATEQEQLERGMRSILKMFAEGRLIYRRDEKAVRIDLGGRVERVRRLRSAELAGAAR